MRRGQNTGRGLPWGIVASVAGLLGIGFFNLYSATRVSMPGAFVSQLLWLGLALVLMIPVAVVDYRVWERLAVVVWAVLCVLLAVVFLFPKINGSHRWIVAGPLRLQPSEPIKIGLILVLARFFHQQSTMGPYGLKTLARPLLYMLVPAGLVLAEPDLGTALILLSLGLTMALVAGVRRTAMIALAVASLVAVPLAWSYGLKDYQKERVITLLSGSSSDTQGAGYHAYQSRIAVGSGGFLGKGYMKGTQNQMRFLPEQHTDFAFAVFAEEFGFVGTLALIGLYMVFLGFSLKVAWLARERFGMLLATGIAALFFLQMAVNVGMVIGVLPVVGMTLPLISYGGSSLLIFLAAVALLINIHFRKGMF